MKNSYTLLGRNTSKTNKTGSAFGSNFGKVAILSIILTLFLVFFNSNAKAQCTNCNSNYPGGTFSTTSSAWSTVGTNIYGGEYAYYNVSIGSTYKWTTCGLASYDTQLTLRQGSNCGGAFLAYSDDFCGAQSQITWTATFTGTVTVLLSQYNCSNNSTNTRIDWKCSNFVAASACTGTPAPGNTVTSSASVATGSTVNLSLSTPPTGTGLTYQWQSAPTSTGSWTNIGTSAATYTATVSATTWYRCLVTCSGATGTSAAVQVSLAYCTPSTTYSGYYISNVVTTTGATNISNNTASLSAGGYGNFTPQSCSQYQGSNLTVATSIYYGYGAVYAWVDWNNDLDFNDVGEQVLISGSISTYSYTHTYTGTFQIPTTAAVGNYRMRIRHDYYSGNTSCGVITYGEAEDYTLTVLYTPPCSGTPAPGNTVTSSASVATGSTVNLSLSTPPTGTGLTYQWQSSTTSSSSGFTSISGATSATYTATVTATTWYQCIVTCSGATGTSAAVQVSLAYCTPVPTSVDGSGITNVSFGTVNNTTTTEVGNYGNYTAQIGTGYQGQLINVNITLSTGFTYGTKIWVDWNNDYQFTDATELMYFATSSNANPVTLNASFTIPSTAAAGNYRMRIGGTDTDTGPTDACYSGSWGSFEDYTLAVIVPAACSGTPTPGNTVTSSASVSSGSTVNLSLSTPPTGTGLTYQWESSTTSSSSGFTSISGATSATYTATVSATTWYQCIVTCSGATGTSAAVQVTLTVCVPVMTYGCTDGDVIARVILNTLDNNSGTGCPSGTAGYSNYTTNGALTTTLQPSSSYNCVVYAGQYNANYAAWIDYNDDLVFDNSTERIGYTLSTVAGSGYVGTLGSSASFPVTLACTPPAGQHVLRIREVYNQTNGSTITPCGNNEGFGYGEIEDYMISIAAAPACPSPGLMSTITTTANSALLTWATNCSSSSNYDFQYGPTGFTLGTGTILSNQAVTISAPNASFNLTGLNSGTTYDVYYRANCGNGVTSSWSLASAFTTINTASAASSSPTLCINTALTSITHTTTGATGIGTATGLPAGVTAAWASNTITISGTPSASGSFSYSIPLTGGCGSVNATGTIIVNALPTVTATASQSICPGSSVTLSGGGASTYSWNNGITNGVAFTPSATATYTVTGTDANGCVNTANSTVTLYTLPTVTATASQSICPGSSVTLSGGGASTYAWNNGITNGVAFTPSATTTYTVTGTDANGCANTANATVTIYALPTWGNLQWPPSGTICAGGSFDIYGQVYENGVTNASYTAPGAGIVAQFGYSTSNSNPNTWTTWSNATYNTGAGNNDEFKGTLSGLSAGTYYYAFRYALNNGTCYVYGAYSGSGGGFWNGTSNINGVLTVNALPTTNAGVDITGASTCGKNTITVNATALNSNETGAWSVVTQGTGATLPGLFSAVTTPMDDFTGSYGGTYTLAWTVTNTTTNCTNTDNMVVTFNQPITTSLGNIGVGDLLWNGLTSNDWSTASNWYALNSAGLCQLQTGTIEPTAAHQVFTLTTAQGGVCIGSNMPTIGNGDNALDVFVGSGITLNLASGSLNLSGNLVNNGIINAAQGTINFIGSTNATVSGSGTTTLNNVTINKSSSATLTLSTNVAVNGVLNMTQGNVVTAASPNGLLTLGASSAVPGTLTWTSGNIVGPFRRFFTTSATQGNEGLFPVGTATYQRYAKVNFTASPGTNQTLTAWYKAGTPMSAGAALYNGLPLTTQDGQLIQNYSADGYWQIDPTDNNYTAPINSANYSIDLYANNLTGMQDPTICRIIKAAGSNTSSSNHVQWQGCGTHTTIPTVTSASAFVINSTSVGGFSWFGAGTSNNQALPVELTSFSGNCADGKVDLEWSTATEHNSAYFQVEYSRDGSVWQNIGVVAAAGNSVQNINYTLTHEQVASGNNYYRLRQVDIDGVEQLYDAIAVTCAAGSDQYIMTYPNPSEQNFQVEVLNENLIGTATLSMVDARGMLIHSELLEVKAGTNLFLFNNTGLAPGIYYVKISKGTYSSEVVKQVVR
jgi:hypothetical protein